MPTRETVRPQRANPRPITQKTELRFGMDMEGETKKSVNLEKCGDDSVAQRKGPTRELGLCIARGWNRAQLEPDPGALFEPTFSLLDLLWAEYFLTAERNGALTAVARTLPLKMSANGTKLP
jgi:hypothetical protein